MEIRFIESKGSVIASLQSDSVIIKNIDDSLDLIGNCGYQGADKIILHEKNLSPSFFDLKTGLAGEMLQKVFQL